MAAASTLPHRNRGHRYSPGQHTQNQSFHLPHSLDTNIRLNYEGSEGTPFPEYSLMVPTPKQGSALLTGDLRWLIGRSTSALTVMAATIWRRLIDIDSVFTLVLWTAEIAYKGQQPGHCSEHEQRLEQLCSLSPGTKSHMPFPQRRQRLQRTNCDLR